MATSTLRAALIVVAIVLGAIVLANAFPGTVTDGTSTIPTNRPTSPGTPTTTPPTTPASPASIEGAVLQVLNGTTTDGLAGATAECLRAAGAVIPEDNLGQPPEDFAVTTLAHVPGERALAEVLEARFFPAARIQEAAVDESKPDVQVTVILGADYEAVAECAA